MIGLGMPLWMRIVIVLACIAATIGVVMRPGRISRAVAVPAAIAVVVVLFGGKSESQKHGYHF